METVEGSRGRRGELEACCVWPRCYCTPENKTTELIERWMENIASVGYDEDMLCDLAQLSSVLMCQYALIQELHGRLNSVSAPRPTPNFPGSDLGRPTFSQTLCNWLKPTIRQTSLRLAVIGPVGRVELFSSVVYHSSLNLLVCCTRIRSCNVMSAPVFLPRATRRDVVNQISSHLIWV